MRIKSLSELIEEARERVDRENELEEELRQEQLRERTLTEVHDQINQWKKKYFNKKLKSPASIYARISSYLLDGGWKSYYIIQVFRKGEMIEQFYVRPEAFDVITRGLQSTVDAGLKSSTETFILDRHNQK